MKACFLSIGVVVVLAFFACTALADPVVIDLVTVGNAGNEGEASGGTVGDARTSGAVAYEYQIGKYEVTVSQYTAFLNAVAATDTYGLYSMDMVLNSDGCQITQSGMEGSFTYSVDSFFANWPVNYVSFWDACRFANWMHNGQPTGAQDASTTEAGAYTLTLEGITDNTIARNTGATWAVTSEDEWYKAAYHKNDGVTGNYWDYPAGSDTQMGNDVTDASGNNGNFGMLSPMDVGVFVNSESPYGTFDQGGNVWEWTESIMHVYNQPDNLINRSIEGGTFQYDSSYAQAAYRIDLGAGDEYGHTGFRLVSLPATAIPGDANNDGKVDGSDVTILAGNWQVGVGGVGGADWGMGDFNGDGAVDGSDVTILAGNWQAGVTHRCGSGA